MRLGGDCANGCQEKGLCLDLNCRTDSPGHVPLVLTHKEGSEYDDQPWEYYHFPNSYRALVERHLGDWFVYYEPRRNGGRQAYVALGRLTTMWPDETRLGHFYVGVANHEPFYEPVPWRDARTNLTFERGLQHPDQRTNSGLFQRAVRELSQAEFDTIVRLGFSTDEANEAIPLPIAAEDGSLPAIAERPLVEVVMQRRVRDRAFARRVQLAYQQTCAFTGLRVVNGGGWTEMEAAHIRPVEKDGPDTVRNGLALSRTMHALFDRGFLTLSNEFEIIEAKSAPLPDQIRQLLPKNRLARVPNEPQLRPHRAFLEFHRASVFKDRAA